MKSFLASLMVVFCSSVSAQTEITGVVRDENNEPVPGANVMLLDTYDGATTDASGYFAFNTGEIGERTIVIRFVGFAEITRTVTLDGTTVSINAVLTEEVNELESVTISAGSFTAGDASRRTVLKPLDIATTAGATADIAGALNTLPGTQKVGEAGRLFVRGGDGNETRTFIDGMVVLDAYAPASPNAPSRGRFLPFMFKGTSFSTGGYSAEYGQALSSALVLDSKDEKELTRTDIGLLSVGADVAHTQAWERGSAAAKIQYTNIRPYFRLINQEIDWKTPPVSLEGVGALRQRLGDQGMLKIYGNFTQTDFSLYNHDIDDYSVRSLYDLTNRYRYINGTYKTALSNDWSIRTGVSYNFIQNDVGSENAQVLDTEAGTHLKLVLQGTLRENIEVTAGMEIINRDYSQRLRDGVESSNNRFTENLTAGFAEVDVFVSNRLVIRSGLRSEYNSLTGILSADPRIAMAYKTGDASQVSLALGQFRQTPKNEWTRIDPTLKPEIAQHYILNYQRIEDKKTFRIEAFYKRYDDLIKFAIDGDGMNNHGYGYAKGIELFWRDNATVPRLDYWISYSFLDTERNYLHFPATATPYFASRHNASVVGKYFVQALKSQVGATYSVTSGRPYHNPNKPGFNASRTPAYTDLSINWSYLPSPQVIVYLSCSNVLGRDNIFGYEYSRIENEDGDFNRRPLRQAAPRFLFLGVFITLSKDKSMNQLPSL